MRTRTIYLTLDSATYNISMRVSSTKGYSRASEGVLILKANARLGSGSEQLSSR